MQTFFLYFGLSGLALTLLALFAVGLWQMDSHPVLEAVSRIRRHPIAVQLFLAAFVLHLIVHGSTKTNANRQVRGGDPTVYGFTSNQLAAGFVLSRVDAGGSCSFAPPLGASVVEAWRLRGAVDDWAPGPASASFPDGSVVFADGRIQDRVRNPSAVFAPFRAMLGVVPEANWPLIAGTNAESMVWHASTPSNSVVVTWRDVLLGRDTNTPVSVQAEFFENGDFDYRYDLGSLECRVESGELDAASLSNVTIAACLGGVPFGTTLAEMATNAQPSAFGPRLSLSFRRLDPLLDSQAADRDGDGISTYDEIFVHGTDPGLLDSDGDGIADGAEVAAGSDPVSRDTDGDGLADGTDPSPTSADSWTDSDGDGLPDAWKTGWFGPDATVSPSADANGDGLSNLASLLCGVNPVAAPPEGFAYPNGASAAYLSVWELFPTAFSFQRPAGLSELAARTFAVGRTSPWEQFYVSSRPDGAGGWTSSDVAVFYGLDGGPATNAVPASASDSWRLPLGSAMPQTVSVAVSATGPSPSLSSPLYLLRWVPGVGFSPSERLAVVEDAAGRTWAAAKRDAVSGMYEVPFAADLSRVPHHGGVEAAVAADLAMPPVAGLSVTNGAFLASNPLLADLPRVGTNISTRLVLYSVEVERPGSVSPGPRESLYAGPYPLTSSSLRKAFHRASGEAPDGTALLTVLPVAEGVGYALVEDAPLRSPQRLRGGSAAQWPATISPPAKIMPEVGGAPCTNDVYEIEGDVPDGHDQTPPEDDDPDGGGEDEECDCGDGGPSLGSFRFRVPLGESASDEHLGFLWTMSDGPAAVTPAMFSVLAAPGVSVVTNAGGALSISASSLGGRTVAVTNIPDGVAVPVWNASGRFEHEWQVFNEGGDPSRIRVRRVTVLGNATMDETYSTWDEDEPEIFWGLCGPAAAWERVDNIRGVAVTRYEWRDADEPDFVVGEYDETRLGGETVRAEMRTYETVGAGALARRRLSCSTGYDEHGWYDEARTYWHDADHPERNARLRSVQSDRRSWAYFDYDSLGREILRIEQFDGSPFPELAEVSASAPLPDGCAATVTATSYDPPVGDDGHRNDSFEPREVSVYVRRGSEPPVMASHEARVYTREEDAAGVPLRRIVKTVGFGGLARAETKVEYPQDASVPGHLRGLPVLETSPDGTKAETAYMLSGNRLVATTRRYGATPYTPNPTPYTPYPTYSVVISDAAYRLPLREETRLTATGAVLDWSKRAYDDIHRLRSVTYSDGTFETNAYSCCRLLWRRDRQGRKTLRSAQTGTDLLYYAEEEVWMGEVGNGEWGTGNGVSNGFKVTRHYFDGLGRETNTVTHVGFAPGEASSMSSPYSFHPSYTSQKTTIYSGDTYFSVDERGLEAYGYAYSSAEGEGSYENVYGESGGEPFFRDTTTFRWRGGGTAVETLWVDKWRREATVPGYLADGRRVEYAVTESSDYGVVTNSVSTYDLLGRLSTVATPGPNGSWLVTSNTYDGASTRMLSTTKTGSLPVEYFYDERGERVGTAQDGRSTWNTTTYEVVSQQTYRVVTSVRMTGSVTNMVRVQKTQLTGLSEACRRHTIELSGRGVPLARITETTDSFDPETGMITSVSRTDGQTPVVTKSIHGVVVERTALDERRIMAHDAFGRNVETVVIDAATGATNRIEAAEYDASGNATVRSVDYGADGIAATAVGYDMMSREVALTNALGNVVETGYDPLGRRTSAGGDAYPLRIGYDTEGRKTSSSTTRDNGAAWDETHWEYDAASGLNTAKEYADGSRIAYVYTDDGRRTRTTWARGEWKENAYNGRNLVSGTTYSGAATPSVAYAYADSGKVASATLSDGTSYAYSYDDSLLCTNETVAVGEDAFSVLRTYDWMMRGVEAAVVITNVRHAAKTRIYDSESRVCGYALTNAAGRGVSVAVAYDGSYPTNMSYALPDGGVFSVKLTRKQSRRELVTRRDYAFDGLPVYFYAADYDLLNRPTNAADSVSVAREWLYNRRSELAAASVGTNLYGYAYDTIGNRLWSAANAVTNSYSANSLNQYASTGSGTNFVYDSDGNMTSDGAFSYSYDAENRLLAAYPLSPAVGSLAVENRYDHRHRRSRKVVKQYDGADWETKETRYFLWDGNNIVLERVEFANGASRTFEYFWGADKSGSEQGAGGVEGLLAVSVDGVFYIPCYDHNGNIVLYVSETGSIAAQYVYDPYGNVIDTYGSLADVFYFGFSTKYHDRETGMVGYKRRFYRPDLGRWLNRDPIEEEGGENLYAFCQNSPTLCYDINGCWAFIDNAIAAIGGALFGVGCQAIADVLKGEASGWESYVGSAVAGAAMGEILLHNPAMAGAAKVMYSGMAAAAGNFVKQVCSVEISKKQESYNTQEIVVDFAAGAAFSMIPFPGIEGVNKGQGSYLSIARSMNKKFLNGSISRVSASTTVKSFWGASVEYGTAYGAAQPYVSDKINQGIDYLGDMMTPADGGMQMFYSETLFIRATDKCGNVVELYYYREISNE